MSDEPEDAPPGEGKGSGANPPTDIDLSYFDGLEPQERQRLLDAASKESQDAQVLRTMMNRGVSSFDPSHLARLLTSNTKAAMGVYGEPFLEAMTGLMLLDFDAYEGHPERKGELTKRIDEQVGAMMRAGYFTAREGEGFEISEQGEELAAVSLLIDELEGLSRMGRGDHAIHTYGEREHGYPMSIRPYRKGDSYRDISVRQSLKRAVVRGRDFPSTDDLRVYERTRSVSLDIVYALDVSGSMHGDKLDAGKKAAVGLAFTGTKAGDRVGVVAFNVRPTRVVEPTPQVEQVAREVASLSPALGTDIAAAIRAGREMLIDASTPHRGRHIIVISDAIPTTGDEDPVERSYEEASITAAADITISLVGIDLSEEGEDIGRTLTRIAGGRFYHISNPHDLHNVVLEERNEARMGLISNRPQRTRWG